MSTAPPATPLQRVIVLSIGKRPAFHDAVHGALADLSEGSARVLTGSLPGDPRAGDGEHTSDAPRPRPTAYATILEKAHRFLSGALPSAELRHVTADTARLAGHAVRELPTAEPTADVLSLVLLDADAAGLGTAPFEASVSEALEELEAALPDHLRGTVSPHQVTVYTESADHTIYVSRPYVLRQTPDEPWALTADVACLFTDQVQRKATGTAMHAASRTGRSALGVALHGFLSEQAGSAWGLHYYTGSVVSSIISDLEQLADGSGNPILRGPSEHSLAAGALARWQLDEAPFLVVVTSGMVDEFRGTLANLRDARARGFIVCADAPTSAWYPFQGTVHEAEDSRAVLTARGIPHVYLEDPARLGADLAEAYAAYHRERGPVVLLVTPSVLEATGGELPAYDTGRPLAALTEVREEQLSPVVDLVNREPSRLLWQCGHLDRDEADLVHDIARQAGVALADSLTRPGNVTKYRDGHVVDEYLGTLGLFGFSARVHDYLHSGGRLRPRTEQALLFLKSRISEAATPFSSRALRRSLRIAQVTREAEHLAPFTDYPVLANARSFLRALRERLDVDPDVLAARVEAINRTRESASDAVHGLPSLPMSANYFFQQVRQVLNRLITTEGYTYTGVFDVGRGGLSAIRNLPRTGRGFSGWYGRALMGDALQAIPAVALTRDDNVLAFVGDGASALVPDIVPTLVQQVSLHGLPLRRNLTIFRLIDGGHSVIRTYHEGRSGARMSRQTQVLHMLEPEWTRSFGGLVVHHRHVTDAARVDLPGWLREQATINVCSVLLSHNNEGDGLSLLSELGWQRDELPDLTFAMIRTAKPRPAPPAADTAPETTDVAPPTTDVAPPTADAAPETTDVEPASPPAVPRSTSRTSVTPHAVASGPSYGGTTLSPDTSDPADRAHHTGSPMTFGFLAHPISSGHRNQIRGLDLFTRLLDEHRGVRREPGTRYTVSMPIFTTVTSATGARCSGDVQYLPYTAEQMLSRPTTAREMVAGEVAKLRDRGARLVGLGGATSIVGDRGLWTAQEVGIPVTSGNSLTTYAAYQELWHVTRLLGLEAERTRVAVIGYPGSIGLALARLLLGDGFLLDLVSRSGNRAPEKLLRHLDPADHDRVRLVDSVAGCSPETRLFICASSVGGLVDPDRLPAGSVVIDVALPRDVSVPPREGQDVLVIDGGLVSAGDDVTVGDGSFPGPTQQLNGCLAETMVLALEGRAESLSLGRDLDLDRIRTIGKLAARHGFHPTPLASFGRPVPDDDILRLARFVRPTAGSHGASGDVADAAGTDITSATKRRFRQRVNPPMAKLFEAHGMDRVFTRGSGCTLTTADGVEYLDFIAGYGCLNLGHNHPGVTERLRRFLDDGSPTFVQYVSMPAQAAELAERLSAVAPPGLDRVFFSNSGTEAVEAALKVARAGTGRTRLVHAENSYHGKTLGALSVTGRSQHRAPFGPLLSDTVGVPYGDIEALRAVIDGAAAFIVEPVQGEGGVVLPPAGYLTQARELCARAGVAFILDEIQTGLGRTGALFAAEHDGLQPDVLCVAKSLSGGLVPIAATLCNGDLWDAAYGSSNRSMLHSSTFGGGNFAAAAGLATLDVLAAENLPQHAKSIGEYLRASLSAACEPYGFVKEVRGIGLMTAIEFDGDFSGAVRTMTDELLTRLPGDLHALADWLPDDLRNALTRAGSAVEATMGDLMCLRFVASLARQHRILTFVTANHNRVLRIQPPLVLGTAEADRFVSGVEAVCRDLAMHADLGAWHPSMS